MVLLCLLVLYGCKHHLLDPLNPQTQLPPKVQLDKIKGFYENGRYKNQPKTTSGNERITAADSARFKDFEPQWDKTEVELLLNNEKMLIVPVVRFLSVEYNQEIGFIRRLCIRVDANDNFLEANIVELVGNLTFVKENHNDIFKNYKNTNIFGFSGYIVVYEIDYNIIMTKEYENSTLKVTPCSSYPVYNEGGLYAIVDNCSGIITIIGTDGGEDTSGGDDGSGGGPPSGGGTYNPVLPVPPCKGSACPKDEGVSWELEPEVDTNLPLPNNVVIIDNPAFNQLLVAPRLKCILNKVLKNATVQAHLHSFYTQANPLKIQFEPLPMGTNANFDEMTNTITINKDAAEMFSANPDAYLAATIFHEVLHSYINGFMQTYGGNTILFQTTGQNSTDTTTVMIHSYYTTYYYNSTVSDRDNQADHNIIADKYLTTIAKFACSIAGLPPKPTNINTMLPIAWLGMNKNDPNKQVVTRWANMPESEKDNYNDLMEHIDTNPLLNNPNFKCQ